MSTAGPENRARRRCSNVDCPRHRLVQQMVEEQGLAITYANINLIWCTDIVYDIIYDIVYDITMMHDYLSNSCNIVYSYRIRYCIYDIACDIVYIVYDIVCQTHDIVCMTYDIVYDICKIHDIVGFCYWFLPFLYTISYTISYVILYVKTTISYTKHAISYTIYEKIAIS